MTVFLICLKACMLWELLESPHHGDSSKYTQDLWGGGVRGVYGKLQKNISKFFLTDINCPVFWDFYKPAVFWDFYKPAPAGVIARDNFSYSYKNMTCIFQNCQIKAIIKGTHTTVNKVQKHGKLCLLSVCNWLQCGNDWPEHLTSHSQNLDLFNCW